MGGYMKEEYILIGFGKQKLSELLLKAKESQEGAQELALACTKHPPHYRTVTASTVAQQEDFVNYVEFMNGILKEDNDNANESS
jgi:hypothetical protein